MEKNLGVVAPVPKGEWNKDVMYDELNIITLRNALYMAKASSQGVEPLVTAGWQSYWMLLFTQSTSNLPSLEAIAIGQIIILDIDIYPDVLYGGGQWLEMDSKFLLPAGSKYNLGDVGGSADAILVEHNGHSFDFSLTNSAIGEGDAIGLYLTPDAFSSYGDVGRGWAMKDNNELLPTTRSLGVDGTGKNMPPYYVIKAWKRIG